MEQNVISLDLFICGWIYISKCNESISHLWVLNVHNAYQLQFRDMQPLTKYSTPMTHVEFPSEVYHSTAQTDQQWTGWYQTFWEDNNVRLIYRKQGKVFRPTLGLFWTNFDYILAVSVANIWQTGHPIQAAVQTMKTGSRSVACGRPAVVESMCCSQDLKLSENWMTQAVIPQTLLVARHPYTYHRSYQAEPLETFSTFCIFSVFSWHAVYDLPVSH